MTLTTDGKLLAGGNFYHVNQVANARIARIWLTAPIAPMLSLNYSCGQMSLLWPTNAGPGPWTIQSSPTLVPASWTVLTPQPGVNLLGTSYQATLPATNPAGYYRLTQ